MLSLLTLATLATGACALSPVTINGRRFIQDGNVYWIKGLDYQPGGASGYDADSDSDVLLDAAVCWRDAYVIQKLGVNTIRVYTVNPDVNHDECMTIFNNAGILVILDVNAGTSMALLDRLNPASTYGATYLLRVFGVIEAFKNYDNVIGFFAGNEIINDEALAELDPPYIRAVQRDMKQYIAKWSDRQIPVGYSAADLLTLRAPTFEYLTCVIDLDDVSKSDFFGLNSYEWVDGSTWAASGYDVVNSTFANTTVPVFFLEFGTLASGGLKARTFNEISDGLFSGLNALFSGGLVYEYSLEANNYGVVEINSDGLVTYQEDFVNLQKQYANVLVQTIAELSLPAATELACDADAIQALDDSFNVNFTLPTANKDITWMIENGHNISNVGRLINNLLPQGSNYSIVDASGNTVSGATVSFVTTYSSTLTSKSASATATSARSSASSTAASSSSKGGAAGVAVGGMGLLAGVLALL